MNFAIKQSFFPKCFDPLAYRFFSIIITVFLFFNIMNPSIGFSIVSEEEIPASSGLSFEEKKVKIGKIGIVRVYIGNLRARPTKKSSIIDKLKRGDKVTILQKKGEWFVVKLQDGRFGWAHQSLFQYKKSISGSKKTHLNKSRKSALSHEAFSSSTAKAENRLTIKVHSGNVRVRPSLSSKILFKLRKGDAVLIKETKGDWFFVKLKDDQFGWAHRSLFAKSYNKKGEAKRFIQEIKEIKPVILSEEKEGVNFIINGYNQPETFVVYEGKPRVVCDFFDTRLGSGISRRIKVNGNLIQQIRIAIHKGFPPKIRIVLDLVPDQDYEVETVLLKKVYSLVVRIR